MHKRTKPIHSARAETAASAVLSIGCILRGTGEHLSSGKLTACDACRNNSFCCSINRVQRRMRSEQISPFLQSGMVCSPQEVLRTVRGEALPDRFGFCSSAIHAQKAARFARFKCENLGYGALPHVHPGPLPFAARPVRTCANGTTDKLRRPRIECALRRRCCARHTEIISAASKACANICQLTQPTNLPRAEPTSSAVLAIECILRRRCCAQHTEIIFAASTACSSIC